MQWVFDQLVEWVLEKLTGCFSVLSSLLFTFFNLDRGTFDAFFSFFSSASGGSTSLYEIFRYFAFAICMAIVILRLLRNLFSVLDDTDYEDPIKLIFRTIVAFVLVAASGIIVNYEFRFVSKPYEIIRNLMEDEVDSFGGVDGGVWDKLSESLKGGMDAGVGDTVIIGLITIGCLIAIFFGFVKLVLEVAERYVVVCVSIYLSPMAFSTFASKGTAKIMQAYVRMVFCQLLLMIFNVVFVDGTLIAIYKYADCGGTITLNGSSVTCPAFVFCILLLAFITAGQKMDAYMRGLSLDVVQTGSLFDEIRGSMLNGMMMARSIAGAVKSAGGVGRAVGNGFATMVGRGSSGGGSSNGGSGVTIGGVKGTVGKATRDAAASVTQTMAQKNSSLQSMAQKAAQGQIKSGAFNGIVGDASKSIAKATETAIGADAFQKLGIVPASLTGKNGMIDFKTQNGATGTLSFDKREGNGWKELTAPDQNGNADGIHAWIKGSSNLGISGAQAGTHQSLSQAIGNEGRNALCGAIGDSVSKDSIEAISLGNGEFSVVGQNADGVSTRLGRIVPAEVGEKISGASLVENEFGGKVGFLPEVDTQSAMTGKSIGDDGLISMGNGTCIPADTLQDALAPTMEASNIAKGTALLGFEADGDTFTASYADPVTGTKEIQGSVNDIMTGVDPEDIRKPDASCEWIGMNNMFDTHAYSAITGETPKNIEIGDRSENGTYGFIVTNESGSKFILDQASATGKYDKVVSGGEMFGNVPFSIQRAPEENHYGGNDYSGSKGSGNNGRSDSRARRSGGKRK